MSETTNTLELNIVENLGFKPATREDYRKVFGVTKSTNQVELYSNESGRLVLKKNISRRGAIRHASNEVAILNHLAGTMVADRFSHLAYDQVIDNPDGSPSLLIEFNKNYLPLGSDSQFFDEIVTQDHPHRLQSIFELIKTMHDQNICHGDLHLNNLGHDLNGPMIIDFDLAVISDYLTPEQILEDLNKILSEIVGRIAMPKREIVSRKIIEVISKLYGDEINPNDLTTTGYFQNRRNL